MSLPRFRLDPDAEQSTQGETVLNTERSFLQCIVQGDWTPSYLVQGRSLCSWVEEWCLGRDISAEYLASPRESWRRWHPQWTDEEIQRLQRRSQRDFAPDTLPELLLSLFVTGPFVGTPRIPHAAEWALWLAQASLSHTDPVYPVLQRHVHIWKNNIDTEDLLLQTAYSLDHSVAANRFLDEWIIEGRFQTRFPLPLPEEWKEKAEEKWRFQILDRGCSSFWQRISTGNYGHELRQIAANLVYIYLKNKREQITQELITSLKPYLPVSAGNLLQQACPPKFPAPISPEATPESVLYWFENDYLPFRQWQLSFGDPDKQAQIEPVAQSFVEWVLVYYPKAISGGVGYDRLVIAESAKRQQTEGVLLWVILDGLPVPDGNRLRDLLRVEKRFQLTENRLCFTTLPTITCFCKSALMNGCLPETLDITETPSPNFASAVVLRDKTMREQVTMAKSGQVLVWSHKEPDSIYHRNQSAETTLAEVESQLTLLASRIQELAFGIPDNQNVTICISTDHGRLLSANVERVHSLPNDATSEGRAAWGHTSAPAPPGVFPLLTERFRLPQNINAWVATDANAFVQSNGGGGKVGFPHGGLWPEEVIVPWFTFVRDATPPALQIQIQGKGRIGGLGQLRITLTNMESFPVTVTPIKIYAEKSGWTWTDSTPIVVPGQHQDVYDREISGYPNTEVSGKITAELVVSLPNGATFPISAEVTLETDNLYSRGLNAQDLLEL